MSGVQLDRRAEKKHAEKSTRKAEPYRLATGCRGIGFETADTIAHAVGISHDSPERMKAGLRRTLS
jgi:ATP-dependent exoDNAse (exonuclease V) alpha subunit